MGIWRLKVQDDRSRESLDSRHKVMAGYENQEIADLGIRVKELRKRYLHPIKGYGNIIRRTDKKEFDAEVERLKKTLDELNQDLLQTDPEMLISIDNFVETLGPLVRQAPPRELGHEPTDKQIENWIEYECRRQLRRKRSTLEITCIFKDVTYESLKSKEFRNQARRAFPDLKAIFDEFDAVRATEDPVLGELAESKHS